MQYYLFPDTAAQLSRVMTEAMAPAFVLAAVASLVSTLLGRMTAVVERIRNLNDISDDDKSRAHLKLDVPRLRRRAKLLESAAYLALFSGMCTALLLVTGFICAYLRLEHVYGVAVLFVLAVVLLGAALFRFAQEVRVGLSEADHYR